MRKEEWEAGRQGHILMALEAGQHVSPPPDSAPRRQALA